MVLFIKYISVRSKPWVEIFREFFTLEGIEHHLIVITCDLTFLLHKYFSMLLFYDFSIRLVNILIGRYNIYFGLYILIIIKIIQIT